MGLTKFSLLRRRQDISHAQFLAHWHTVHVDVLVNKGRHRHYNKRYIQNDFQSPDAAGDLVFDGAAQMVPQSGQFVQSGFQQDPLYARFVRPDEDLFLAPQQCVVLYCESETLGSIPTAKDCRKIFCLIRRMPGTPEGEFLKAWQSRGRQMLETAAMTGLLGIRQHRVLPGAATHMGNGQGLAHPVDLVEELFFGSEEALQAFFRNPKFLDTFHAHGAMPLSDGSQAFLAQERLVYEGE